MNNLQASRATLTCKCHVKRCPTCGACARCGCDHDGRPVEYKITRRKGRPRKEEIEAHQFCPAQRNDIRPRQQLESLAREPVLHGQLQPCCPDAEEFASMNRDARESNKRLAGMTGTWGTRRGTEKRRKTTEGSGGNEGGASTVSGRDSSEEDKSYPDAPELPSSREAQNVRCAVSVGGNTEAQALLRMKEMQGARNHISSLLSAAKWIVSHPCCELRKKYLVDIDEERWRALEHKTSEIENYEEQLEPLWSVISTCLGPILQVKESYKYVDELFAHRDDWERLIMGIRGRNSCAMRVISRMVDVLLESNSSWSKEKAREKARKLKILIYNEVGLNLFPKLANIVYEEALNKIVGGERSMSALTESLKSNRAGCLLSRQFYRDVVYKVITDMGWSVVRDSSSMVRLLGKGQARGRKLSSDVVINNEDEVGSQDIAALLPYWFTIDGTQLCFTDGVVAYEGRAYYKGSRVFIPKLRQEAVDKSIIERSLLVPFVPGNWCGDPSPYLRSINIDALKLFWQIRMTGRVKEFAGVDFTYINSLPLDDPRVFDDPMLSREAIRILITPYVEALRELCPSSVRGMNLYHSLRLLREYKSNAKDPILKAFAERNLKLLGYRGLVIEIDGRKSGSRSRRRLVLTRYTPRHLEELLDNAGVRLEFFINSRKSVTIRSVTEVCNYVTEDGKLDPWIPLIVSDMIGQITRWDFRNLTESNYLGKIPPVTYNENALTRHPRPPCDPFLSEITRLLEELPQNSEGFRAQGENSDSSLETLCSVEESHLLRLLGNNNGKFGNF